MTARHSGYVVTLATDLREDDARDVLAALRMVKGVVSVESVLADGQFHTAEARVRTQLSNMLYELAGDVLNGRGKRDGR